MGITEQGNTNIRARDPFDDSAVERLRRMGLLTESGKPDQDALATLCYVYAGQYYDDLCDFFQDMETVNSSLRQFIESAEQAEAKQRFLQMCLQFDAIYRPLPDPVWWISGNPELADLFSSGFISRLRQFVEQPEGK